MCAVKLIEYLLPLQEIAISNRFLRGSEDRFGNRFRVKSKKRPHGHLIHSVGNSNTLVKYMNLNATSEALATGVSEPNRRA